MRYINLTPHAINLRVGNDDVAFPPSGLLARVASAPGDQVEGEYPTYSPPTWGDVEGLPGPEEGVTYIVSGIVASRVARPDVVAPGTGPADGAIRSEDGRISAVRRFIRSV